MIRFEQFTKRFGDHVAVGELSLEVERGSVVALLGPNGSGKTTSLKAAAGLLAPTSGCVLVGEPPGPSASAVARRSVSFLPQRVSFPEALSGEEVVEFYRALRNVRASRVGEVLRAAALNGAGSRAVCTYSGGMVQRLGLAVALLPDAPVLLLDEPTAALDPDGLCTFYGVVDRHREHGRTVLFTSHQLGDVERLADRIAVLVDGRLVATFTAGELAERLADRGVMRVRVSPMTDRVLERVRLVAPRAAWSGPDLVIPGPAAERAHALAAVQETDATIGAITAEEGRLDVFYHHLTHPPAGEGQ